MRTVVLAFLFAALGAGTAWVATGQPGQSGVKRGIPQASAEQIKSQLSDIEALVEEGNCEPIAGKLSTINAEIDALPRSTSKALKSRLRSGVTRLTARAQQECRDNKAFDTTTQSVPSTSTTIPETTVPSSSTTPPTTQTTPTTTQPKTQTSPQTQTQTQTQTSTRTTPQPTSPSGGGAGPQSGTPK